MPKSFDLDDRMCLKLQQVISKISFYLTMKPFLMLLSCFENMLGKGEDCIFLGRPVCVTEASGGNPKISNKIEKTS